MTSEQIKLVKDSWAQVLPIKEAAADVFYDRLFETHPEVKHHFTGDMQAQGRKLMAMLNTAVISLDDLDGLAEPLRRSGKAHKGHGVKPEDYRKLGDAFLWTLERGLGEAFTPDVRDAWTVVYTTVAGVMIEGAEYSESEVGGPARRTWWQTVFGARAAAS